MMIENDLGGGYTMQYTDQCIIEIYIWNLYNLINQCIPINLILKKYLKNKQKNI